MAFTTGKKSELSFKVADSSLYGKANAVAFIIGTNYNTWYYYDIDSSTTVADPPKTIQAAGGADRWWKRTEGGATGGGTSSDELRELQPIHSSFNGWGSIHFELGEYMAMPDGSILALPDEFKPSTDTTVANTWQYIDGRIKCAEVVVCTDKVIC